MDQPGHSSWTRADVEARLIAAFRAMPSCPVYSHARRVRTTDRTRNALTDVLDWRQLLDDDPDARKYLFAWASRMASGASFGVYVHEMGWKRSTVETKRRRGAETIARRLTAAGVGVPPWRGPAPRI